MAQQRNNAISIAKGFAIIFVVMAHADMPGMLNRAIYLFHMPLFSSPRAISSSTRRWKTHGRLS